MEAAKSSNKQEHGRDAITVIAVSSRETEEACKRAGLLCYFLEHLSSTHCMPGAVLVLGAPQGTRWTKSPVYVELTP